MNKIIAAFDGLKMSEANIAHTIATATATDSFVTGVFLDDRTYTSYKIYELVMEEGVSNGKLKKYQHDDLDHRRRSSEIFAEKCKEANINFNIHHDKNVALQELLHESIFSDLLIISNKENFTHHEEPFPSRFIRDLLSDTQCPVLLTPEKYHPVEKLVFLYDGEPPAVFAIKMFNYLFANYNLIDTEVISVRPMEATGHVPDNKLIKELMKRHYDNVNYTVLKGIASEEILNYLRNEKKQIMVVMGAYRRTMMSRWFRSALADQLVKQLSCQVFIAHNK